MKKIFAIIIILISIFFILLFFTSKKKVVNNKNTNIQENKLDYYNYDNEKRYQNFSKLFPNLSKEEIITRVNIGLDQKPYTNTKESPYLNKDYILVNKYTYLPETYVPNNLEDLDISYARSGMKLVKNAKNMLEKMITEAKNDGYIIRIISSYRSYSYQNKLYNEYVQTDGSENADTYSARPGFSEHQTGLCVDVDDGKTLYTSFEQSPSFIWMQKNSYKYGFILRYPKGKEDITMYTYEAWHYRYVGKKIAEYIHEHNITLDEYYVKFIAKN